MRRVRCWVRVRGSRRVLCAVIAACALVSAVGCSGEMGTPVSPSSVGSSLPSASSGAAVPSGDEITVQAAPASYAMEEVNASGYSGACAVGTGGSGFTIKTGGHGAPNTTIKFVLERLAGGRRELFVDVNDRGVFRTSPDRIDFFFSGDVVRCQLRQMTDDALLAEGLAFDVP